MKLLPLVLLMLYSTVFAQTVEQDIVYSDVVKTEAQYWQLNPADYVRSLALKTQYMGLVSQDITPIEILGIFAQTASERAHYAKLFARLMRDTTGKVLAFQKSVNQAHKDLYGADSLFDYVPSSAKQSLIKRQRYIIDIDACDVQCMSSAQNLITNSVVNPVDFYFKNATDDKIQQWASDLEIDVYDVQRKRITLNYASEGA